MTSPDRLSFLQEQSCNWEHEKKYISTLPSEWVKSEVAVGSGGLAVCGQFAGELVDTLNLEHGAVFVPTRLETLLSLDGQPPGKRLIHPSALGEALPKTGTLLVTSPALGNLLVEEPELLGKLAYAICHSVIFPCLIPPRTVMAVWGDAFGAPETRDNAFWRLCANPGKPATLSLVNYRDRPVGGVLGTTVHSSSHQSRCRIRISGPNFSQDLEFQTAELVKIQLMLPPGITELRFQWLGPVAQDPAKPEVTSFALRELSFTDSSGEVLLDGEWAHSEDQVDPSYCAFDEKKIRSVVHAAGFNEVSGRMAGRIPARLLRLATTRRTHEELEPYEIEAAETTEHRSYFDVTWFAAYRLPQHISLPKTA